MTKPDYRTPKPRKPDDMLESLLALRRWLDQTGYVLDSALGALAMLNTVGTAQLGDAAVTLAKIANISTSRILGRTTAGSGVIEELTGTAATALLDAFTSGLKGLAPASGGGTANFLRADGSWAAPPSSVTTTIRLGSDHTIASTTATEVTGLRAALTAGTYVFQYFLIVQTTAPGAGLAFGINYTGTTTRFVAARRYFSSGTTAANGFMASESAVLTGSLVEHNCTKTLSTTAPTLGPNTGGTNDVDLLNIIEGVITVSDSADLALWHASETATTTSVESESSLVLTKVA